MKKVSIENTWPLSWQYSYPYDQLEIYGDLSCRGYAFAYATRSKQTLSLIKKVVPAGGSILDLAAAQGNFSLMLAEMGYEVTWNDLREELVNYVKMKHEHGTILFAPGNAFELNFNSCFDAVLIAEIIEHVAHPDEFLTKVGRMVKPGGHVIMTTPNGGYFKNRLPKFSECKNPEQFEDVQFKPNSDGHIFLLHMDEIEALANQAGLSILEMLLCTNSLTNGHIKLEKILRIIPRLVVDRVEQITNSFPMPARKKIHTNLAVLLQRPR